MGEWGGVEGTMRNGRRGNCGWNILYEREKNCVYIRVFRKNLEYIPYIYEIYKNTIYIKKNSSLPF